MMYSKSIKSSSAFFLSNLIVSGISYLTIPIYTRILSPSQFGEVSVFLTWYTLIGILAMFSLSSGVFNVGMVDYPTERDKYSFSMLILSNIISVVVFIVFLISYSLVEHFFTIEFHYILLMFGLYFTLPAYNFWTCRQRYELKYKASFIWSIVFAIISPIFAITCICLFPNHVVFARIFGSEIPVLIVCIGFYLFIASRSNFKLETKYWKDVLKFNIPLIPHYLSLHLLSSSDRLMISYYEGNNATAYYTIAYSIATLLIVVWSAINASLVPFTFEHCKQNNYAPISKVSNILLIFFATLCFLIILIGPDVIAIVAEKQYLEAIYAIPPIVSGVFFQVCYFIFSNLIFFYKKTHYIMYASVSAAMINVILNIIFIPRFGYIAAGYTTLISYIFQAIFDYFAMKMVMRKNIYNSVFLILISCIVVSMSLFSGFLYDYSILRYLLCLLIISILIFKRHDVIILLRVKGLKE